MPKLEDLLLARSTLERSLDHVAWLRRQRLISDLEYLDNRDKLRALCDRITREINEQLTVPH